MDPIQEKVAIHEKIARLETQFDRFIADAESEKRTRRVMIEELKTIAVRLDERLRHVERFVYVALGAVAIIEFIAKIFH